MRGIRATRSSGTSSCSRRCRPRGIADTGAERAGADNAIPGPTLLLGSRPALVSVAAVEDKSNEITAIPELLELLDVTGATVTIDAMGCQHAIAKRIVAGDGDYVLGLKDNQPTLREDVQVFLDAPPAGALIDTDEQLDEDHGRIERRTASVCTGIEWLRERHPNCGSLGSNLNFGEDASRVRWGHAVANLTVIRHTVLNTINAVTPARESVKRMRKRTAWSEKVLHRVLQVLI